MNFNIYSKTHRSGRFFIHFAYSCVALDVHKYKVKYWYIALWFHSTSQAIG